MNEQLDPQLVTLAKSLREVESNNNPTAAGKSGEYGAYQFMPSTWDASAPKYGVKVPLKEASLQQQNEVAYKQLAEWKQAHPDWNVGNFASAWNAGPGKPDAYLGGNAGTNSEGVQYDTGAYAKKVAEAYQKNKQVAAGQSSGYNPTPYSNPTNGAAPGEFDFTGNTQTEQPATNPDSLSGQLGDRLSKGTSAIGLAGTGASEVLGGQIGKGIGDFASGALQTVGQAAGGVGDVANKALEFIPGVKQAEGLIGKAAGSVLNTSGGQQAIQAAKSFSENHPNISGDLGAAFNIATAIPILKGFGLAKNVVMDAASLALKNQAEKTAIEGFTKTAASTIGGRKAISAAPDAISTLVKERALPIAEDGKWSTGEADVKLNHAISDIEDNELQPALNKANVPETSSRIPLNQYKQEAITEAENQLKDSGPIEAYFERLQKKYGDYPTLQQMNEAKRIVSKNITDAGFASPTVSTDKIVRGILQKSVEDGASALGLEDVNAINQKMSRLIKAQNVLSHINGKSVKLGAVGDALRTGATVGGEALGNMTGIPFAGAYAGYRTGGIVGKKLTGISESVLKRTGKGAERISLREAVSKSKSAIKGALLQKAARI